MEGTPETTAAEGAASGRRRRAIVRIALLAVGLVALVWLGREVGAYVPRFAEWVQGLGFWGPLVFVVGYAVAVVGFVPGSILTLGAGAIFGLAAGTVYVFVAASLGACAAFLVARYFARAAIERRVAGNPRFAAIDRAIAEQGRRITFLLRLSPVFPFNLLNYALGLTRVRFADYAVACLGMLPGTLLYVYLGSVAGDLAAVAGGAATADADQQRWITWAGLAVTAAVTLYITRVARRALQSATGEGAAEGGPA